MNDEIENWLRQEAIMDAGFSARVMAALPPPKASWSWRVLADAQGPLAFATLVSVGLLQILPAVTHGAPSASQLVNIVAIPLVAVGAWAAMLREQAT